MTRTKIYKHLDHFITDYLKSFFVLLNKPAITLNDNYWLIKPTELKNIHSPASNKLAQKSFANWHHKHIGFVIKKLQFVEFSLIMDAIMELFRENNYEAQLGTTTKIQEEFLAWMRFQGRIRIVIPPNSNTFPDWRRTCHVPLVKTQWRPRANKTQWRPRETTTWALDSHVIWRCAPWNRGKFVYRSAWCKSHWSRTFLIRDGIHYSRKGIYAVYSRKNTSCRLTKGKIWTFCVSKLVVWRHVRQLARWSWLPGRKVFVIYNKICCSWSNQTQNTWVKR